MKYFAYSAFVVLVLLSISTGITKIVQLPAEMELFRNAGFNDSLTILFGGVQVLGGLLLIFAKYRKTGAVVMIVTFVIASWVVWLSGMLPFFGMSLLFIILATLPFWKNSRLPGDQ
jgi:DoxX-like family